MLEVLTAVLTGSFGLAVIISSLDNGIGWGEAGVDPGTFPFLTGVIILAGSLYNLARGWLAAGIAVSRADLRRIAGLFVPAAIFVGAIPLAGMYVASAGYIFGVLALPKHQSLARSLIIAVATPVALYIVFERMFQVSLPHGELAAALGY
ncbi:tripartite tricarboxylate transporter TctB family protein [Bradyrhizobium sp. STM 3562]|uniref:tripartite tricarboxylate transporter TctB family protein n=1 Tax=Bradyrhizobium sp. STM 3562 TaxID=578924 RepID=UPI003890E394